MTIKIESTTDTPEAVAAAIGGLKQKEAPEVEAKQESAASDEAESTEESETSDVTDKEDGEELESKEGDGSDDDDSKEKDDEKPKKSGFKKRVERLNRRLSEKDKELEYWKAEALKKGKPDQEADQPAKKAESSNSTDRPREEDFDTHAEFIEALTDWKIEQRDAKQAAEAKAKEAKSSYEKKVEKHQERIASFREKTADYDDVLSEAIEELGEDFAFSPAIEQSIVESEDGPALMYALAKDLKELERINKLPPIAAARELGKFEARLAKAAEPETPEVKKSKAPPPLAPVGTKSSGSVRKSIYDENLSQKEFERLREESLARRA